MMKYKNGLVFGKFMPLHNGHVELITFAAAQCETLHVLVCIEDSEYFLSRTEWLKETFSNENIKIQTLYYSKDNLPVSSKYNQKTTELWGDEFQNYFYEKIDAIFTSEEYGIHIAKYMNAEHIYYNQNIPIHATDIRNNIYANWRFLPDAVKKSYIFTVCIVGTESTGKTMLSQKLAEYFNCSWVPEMGRELIKNTDTCTPKDLQKVAIVHDAMIQQKLKTTDKILIIDTDVNITKSYHKFLFDSELDTDIKHNFDIYIYLDSEAPYVNDGTRLSEDNREELDDYHYDTLRNNGIYSTDDNPHKLYYNASGAWNEFLWNWDSIFDNSIKYIEHSMNKLKK